MSGVRCPGEQRKVAEARRPERRLGSSRGSPVRKSLRKSPPRRRTKARPSTHHPSTSSRRPGALYAPEGAAAARETHSAGDPARAPAGHGPARCDVPGRACARKRPHRSPSLRARLGLWASATQIRPRAAADLNNQFGFHGEKIHHHNRRGRQPRSREKKVWERGATSSRPRPWRCSGPSSCRPQPRPPMTKTYAGRPSRCLHSMRPAFAAMGSRTQK